MAKKTESAKTKKQAPENAVKAITKEELVQIIMKNKPEAANESVEKKLNLLYELQLIDSALDEIIILRGELPNEVKNLEDDVAGLETRIDNIKDETKKVETSVSQRKLEIENSNSLIKKYEEQQKNVRNNREFESLAKEIEFQNLEIELQEKRIKEANLFIKDKKELLEVALENLEDRKNDLKAKEKELKLIVAETEKEEKELVKKGEEYHAVIEPRLLNAYLRLRKNARNGLAVVEVRRDACGGCFNKIPPQRIADIKMAKKIIACEYCGRILIDRELDNE